MLAEQAWHPQPQVPHYHPESPRLPLMPLPPDPHNLPHAPLTFIFTHPEMHCTTPPKAGGEAIQQQQLQRDLTVRQNTLRTEDRTILCAGSGDTS